MSIDLKTNIITIRVYAENKTYENRDKYKAVMTGIVIAPDTIILQGAHGELTRKDIINIHKELAKIGYINVTFERLNKIRDSFVSKKLNRNK